MPTALTLTVVEETTLGAPNAAGEVKGGAHEPLPHLEGLFRQLDSDEQGGARTTVAFPAVAGQNARDQGGVDEDG